MGTFHHDKHELHGITVVVDTEGPKVFVGRCDEEAIGKVGTSGFRQEAVDVGLLDRVVWVVRLGLDSPELPNPFSRPGYGTVCIVGRLPLALPYGYWASTFLFQ